jgi:membrane-associated protease RseP (regulator of RpoE activity)
MSKTPIAQNPKERFFIEISDLILEIDHSEMKKAEDARRRFLLGSFTTVIKP